MILLDSSVLIEFFRRSNKATTVFYKLSEKHGPFCISIVTYYEVLVGSTEEQGEFWSEFFKEIAVIDFDVLCANKAILIYKHLRGKNMLIDLADIFIAATCLANNLEIVTLNRKHFKRIDGLRILENYK